MQQIRIFIEDSFVAHHPIQLSSYYLHYLVTVMRCRSGDFIRVFNGRDGEWNAVLQYQKKNIGWVVPQDCLQEQPVENFQVSLLQGLIKRQDWVIEKATELGVTQIFPLKMERCMVKTLNAEKAKRWIIEAAEQSERLTLPLLHPVNTLQEVLGPWEKKKKIFWAAERKEAIHLNQAVQQIEGDIAVLIGPEGGMSSAEQEYLEKHPAVVAVSLGRGILRSETAVIAALALTKAVLK
jgi:16S rRNA (uracil1498-N3)-methyltransferase